MTLRSSETYCYKLLDEAWKALPPLQQAAGLGSHQVLVPLLLRRQLQKPASGCHRRGSETAEGSFRPVRAAARRSD